MTQPSYPLATSATAMTFGSRLFWKQKAPLASLPRVLLQHRLHEVEVASARAQTLIISASFFTRVS